MINIFYTNWRVKFKFILIKFATVLVFTFFIGCNSELKNINIPFQSNINMDIDGFFNEEYWNDSYTIQITPNNNLYLLQDEDHLYLGIKNNENVARYADVYIESVETFNLHASMQLGERELTDNWNDTNPKWNWGNNNNWMANKVIIISNNEKASFFESIKPYQGHEFKISKKKIKNREIKIRLEIKDFEGQAADIVYPTNSKRFNKNTWLSLEVK